MRRALGTALRFALGAAAIAWLLRGMEGEEAWRSIRRAERGWLAIVILAQLGSKWCWLYRWKVLLSPIGTAPKTIELVRLLLVGHFLNNFLPSSVGGDVSRGLGLASTGISRAKAAASVVADRLVGIFAIALSSAFGCVVGGLLAPSEGPWTGAALLSLGTALAVGTLFHPRALASFGRLPFLGAQGGVFRRVRKLLDAGRLLAGEKAVLRRAVVLVLGTVGLCDDLSRSDRTVPRDRDPVRGLFRDRSGGDARRVAADHVERARDSGGRLRAIARRAGGLPGGRDGVRAARVSRHAGVFNRGRTPPSRGRSPEVSSGKK